MKIWSFIYPDPDAALESARVASPELEEAEKLLQSAVAGPLPEALTQYCGEIPLTEPGVLCMIPRSKGALAEVPR